ncbi:MAG: hypothetical protein J2P13_04425 [Acidobacteria bacterium]|nr:hypothetical protein [Acidobacteriota bacterium]
MLTVESKHRQTSRPDKSCLAHDTAYRVSANCAPGRDANGEQVYALVHRPAWLVRLGRIFAYTARVRLWCLLALLLVAGLPAAGPLSAADQAEQPVTRWEQASPGCTLRRNDDGRTYYGITSGDFEAVLGVDSRELENTRRRAAPVLSLLLSFRYNGPGALTIPQNLFTLEFVKHSHVVKSAFVPGNFVSRLQRDADDLTEVEQREVRRHPDEESEKDADLQLRLKEYTELMRFVRAHALRHTVLSRSQTSVSGWVFFTTEDRWIGAWHKPEAFVLRIPLAGAVLEFPFSLPPEGDKLQLRRRPGR